MAPRGAAAQVSFAVRTADASSGAAVGPSLRAGSLFGTQSPLGLASDFMDGGPRFDLSLPAGQLLNVALALSGGGLGLPESQQLDPFDLAGISPILGDVVQLGQVTWLTGAARRAVVVVGANFDRGTALISTDGG